MHNTFNNLFGLIDCHLILIFRIKFKLREPMQKITTLILFLISLFTFSQQMPIDFSDNQEVFSVFGGTTFATPTDPADSGNTVGEFFNSGGDANQGFFIDLTREIDLSFQQTISLSFYAFDPNNHSITLKLEQGGGDPDIEITQSNIASQNAWTNNITFDFGTNVGTYSRLTIFIDLGAAVPGTYLIDDIDDGTTPTDPNAIDVVYDVLAWSDDFDSGSTPQAINSSNWHHQTFGPNGGRWFNNEEQHYTDRIENSYVQNGNLYIMAKKENYPANGVTLNYTSARLNSKYAFKYGRVDVRAKLPLGAGTWPAIWTLGKNISEPGAYWETQGFGNTPWPACGEIDIMEHGLHATNEVSSAIHTPSSSGATVNTDTYQLTDVHNNYHVYSMNWSPNQITFLIDGVGYYTYKPSVKNASTWPFDLEQFLLLNVAMGGIGGTIDPNFTQSPMVIDYVKVYQNADILSTKRFTGNTEVRMYPNPTINFVNISSDVAIEAIEMYNVLGKKVHQVKTNSNTLNLDVSTFAKGLYILKFNVNNETVIKKLIVK